MNPRPPGYEPGELPDCSTPRRLSVGTLVGWNVNDTFPIGTFRHSNLPHLPTYQSGKRDSNPRPQPWQGCALPTELFPRNGWAYRRSKRADARPWNQPQSNLYPRRRAPCAPMRLRVCASSSYGGEGDRTPDLVNAIHALSQLSYAPVILGPAKRLPAGTRHLTGAFCKCQAISRPNVNFSAAARYHRVSFETTHG